MKLFSNFSFSVIPSCTQPQKVARKITVLMRNGNVVEAQKLLLETPSAFCDLPEDLKDCESLALSAMSRGLAAGNSASWRLKSDIEFFIKVFNSYSYADPIARVSAHDLLFMLEYAKFYLGYRHEISPASVTSSFTLSQMESPIEIGHSATLIGLAKRYPAWFTGEKEHDITYLKAQAPGFAEFSYRYAYAWAYAEHTSRAGDWRF